MFGLIDGNSFYCSCERAFDPRLRGKPLVVLSNNDGCVIARTDEAKDFGIKMGDPWHLIKGKPGINTVEWRSSNYELYGDMSRRMYQVLEDIFPVVEPYSIDEMFLDLRGIADSVPLGLEARRRVRAVAKIPTCVGIGPTKTIAKLANRVAKKDRDGNGVCDFSRRDVRDVMYPLLDLGDVWGLGPASVKKLNGLGIHRVSDFTAMPTEEVRKNLTVTGLRTHAELRGQSCVSMASAPPPRKMLAVTRSFGRAITSWEEIQQAVTTYAELAARRLRAAGLVAAGMQVFMHTNPFAPRDPQYSPSRTFGIEPSSDSFALVGAASRAAKGMWKPDYRYSKAGVVLLDLYPAHTLPVSMFPSRDAKKSEALMLAMDRLTDRHGRGAVRVGSTAPEGGWNMRRGRLSPRYTTCADEMLVAGVCNSLISPQKLY